VKIGQLSLYSMSKKSLHHSLTFLLLHPPKLYLIYTVIRIQQLCHQKLNLPNNGVVLLFHLKLPHFVDCLYKLCI